MLYPEHSLGESYPSGKMQSVYSAASVDWANKYTSSLSFMAYKCPTVQLKMWIPKLLTQVICLLEWNLDKMVTEEWCTSVSQILQGARGVMVIVVGNGHGDTS